MDTLHFGIIGFGRFGKHYGRLLQEIPGVKLVAVANTSSNQNLNEIKTLHPDIIITNDPNEVLQSKGIDCVIIATPPSTHAELIKEALKQGKHVLVEKPMVLSTQEADEIKKILPKNLTFMVGYQYVYNDYIRYLKDNLLQKVGALKYILAEKFYCGPIRYDVGCFLDASPHDLSIINYLVNPGSIAEVQGSSLYVNQEKERDDFTAATIGFERGLKAHLITSWFMPEKTTKLTLVGEKGMIVFNDVSEEKLVFYPRMYPTQNPETFSYQMTEESKVPPEVIILEGHEPLQNEVEHFINSVRNKSTPITNFEFASQITKMNDVIQKNLKK